MAKKIILSGILAILLVFGMMVVGCDNDSTDDEKNGNGGNTSGTGGGGGNGGFTLTGIPSQYNGKYAAFGCGSNTVGQIYGVKSINFQNSSMELDKISNGSITIPGWTQTQTGGTISTVRYSGSETIQSLFLGIYDTEPDFSLQGSIVNISFTSVTFTNGSATKSWSDGTANTSGSGN